METILTSTEKQSMVSSFLEIAVGQTTETARQFLQATSWQLEEAIQLFYIGNEGGGLQSTSASQPAEDGKPVSVDEDVWKENSGSEPIAGLAGEDEVRPPLPVKREVLYDDATLYGISRVGHPVHEANSRIAFRNFDEESKRHAVWESDQTASSSATEAPRDNLASLYRPPFPLMYHGPFDKAKVEATHQGKWLLVNIQSTKEFSSHILNRDTWANEAVAETIRSNFIFWQVYDDTSEGRKVCTYYNLYSIPVVLVIDPITGQKLRSWNGMVEPERLLEDLVPYLDKGPKDHFGVHSHKRLRESHTSAQSFAEMMQPDETVEEDEELLRALAASLEDKKQVVKPTQVDTQAPKLGREEKTDELETAAAETSSNKMPTYPPLPEEPKGDRSLLCRVGVRLPDGQRLQRNFLRKDPIQLLWSFCSSQLNEGDRAFRLTQAIPGASRTVDYTSSLTFDESGLANSMISVAWE
ncbi:plant UBX domain-containing protein 7-like [Aristolochia californica]|uniref:plant UBX domain-containing protein 7-like n=1 Tax=Aristolochia californica TaxID=171875 RepID=UPI0035D8DC41